ncbi:hypothetical protein [Streptomyces canus]|uniref:DinB/UmuC family translesion DNA polymerase n=1 Tax=Streptomyces canus TaxID=58343 RepID=UPI0038695D08
MRYRFDEHTLDGAAVRAALLDLVDRLGTRLRGRGQAARALTPTLKFADGSSWEKTRRLAAPSAHEDDLRPPSPPDLWPRQVAAYQGPDHVLRAGGGGRRFTESEVPSLSELSALVSGSAAAPSR